MGRRREHKISWRVRPRRSERKDRTPRQPSTLSVSSRFSSRHSTSAVGPTDYGWRGPGRVRYSSGKNGNPVSYLRIAAEEAFAPPELLQQYRELLSGSGDVDPGFESLWGHYLGKSAQATA